jgi:hypothetical protein
MISRGEYPEVSSTPVRVRCPRCGYDQRGVVATWTASCALQGRCAECGLAWEWADLLNDKRHKPRWCVEYAHRWWLVPIRTITTLVTSLLPWAFWRSLQMWHAPRLGRIMCYLLMFAIPMYGAVVYEVAMHARFQWSIYNSGLSMPGAFPATARVNETTAVLHAALLPFSQTPSGTTVFTGGWTQAYPHTPRMILAERFPNSWGYLGRSVVLKTLAFPVLLAGLVPVAFALLPVSRRSARVQWRHLGRVAIYSFAFVLLAIPWFVHRMPSTWFTGLREADAFWGELATFSFIIVPVTLVIWWSAAISRHLHMRHAWPTAFLLTVLVYLVLMAAGYFQFIYHLHPEWLAPSPPL